MAFHQPTARQSLNRVSAAPAALLDRDSQAGGPSQSAAPHLASSQAVGAGAVEESQTWVLFSPADDAATASTTSASHLSSALQHDPAARTPGRSRASEGGSADTIHRSDLNSTPLNSAVRSVISGSAMLASEEDAELDVLDSHLPEFRQAPHTAQNQKSGDMQATASSHPIPVLPTHDGLGSFRLASPAGAGGHLLQMQEHIYAFERYNPRRVKRRRESLDLARLEAEIAAAAGGPHTAEAERNRRIEAWRQEQSLLLLEAIRRETRRRRQHAAPHVRRRESGGASDAAAAVAAVPVVDELRASLGNSATSAAADLPMAETEWHEQDDGIAAEVTQGREYGEGGLLSRLTRKVISDLLGLDDKLLAILLGEALPDEEAEAPGPAREHDEREDLSSTPKASTSDGAGMSALLRGSEESCATTQGDDSSSSSWQLRVLERIARELGFLVHRMSAHHPGAFAAYSRLHQTPLPYAGLPVIPEAEVAAEIRREETTRQANVADETADGYVDGTASGMPSVVMPKFRPTVPPQLQSADGGSSAQPIPIPARQQHIHHAQNSDAADYPTTFTQQEWERELDIGLVFRYLRSRFMSSSPSSSDTGGGPPHTLSATSQDAAARAARVRLYHPLVGRNAPRRTNASHAHSSSLMSSPAGPATVPMSAATTAAALQTRQRSPSCGAASQQSARSRRSGVTRRSGSFSVASAASRHSSRHYWDIGGSVGTGSMIASTGPMGSWGEV